MFQIRIEDNIAVTSNGIEMLTSVPRTVAEIEELMAEGLHKYENSDDLGSLVPVNTKSKV